MRSVCGGFLASLLLVALLGVPVFANETIFVPEESERVGSITIQLEDTVKNLSKENVHMTIVKIADVLNGQFVLHDEYANTKIDLNSIHSANELENAAAKLKEKAPDGEVIVTNRNGVAAISDLTVGVYLVYASDIAGYEEITPALVSIPVWDEVESEMEYDIEILPKHTPLPEEGEPDIPQTGVQDHALMYFVIAACAFIISGICIIVKHKEKGRTLQKK